MTKIKICGLRRKEDVEMINCLKPDFVGFVLAESRRRVTPEEAAALRKVLRADIPAVGVFRNEDPRRIEELLLEGIIDIAQLHGRETEETVRQIRQLTGKPVIKAVSVSTAADPGSWNSSAADCLLLDHGSGGSGQPFDWQLVQNIRKPFFLAGGLTPANVTAALAAVRPAGVDVSSGVETDGYKDRQKITAFIRAVRQYDQEAIYGR